MPDVELIAGAVSSLKAAFDLSKALLGIRDATLLNEKVVELQRVILAAQSDALAAQSAQFALLEAKRHLEKRVAEIEKWEAEEQKYELKEVTTGAFAFALKVNGESAEPAHWLCASCFHNHHKSILQAETRTPGMARVLACHECGSAIYLNGPRREEHAFANRQRRR